MSEPLMTIGAYARAVGVPASALRHYDEVGLLPPDHVDQHTGYRYYSTESLRRAGHIRDLRDAGVPIETMRQVLDDQPGEGAAMLRALATRQEDSGVRTAALLRQLAIELDSRTAPGTVLADGVAVADAVRAAAGHVGTESPFDRVVLAAEPTGLDVIATNTFTLIAHRGVAPSAIAGRVALRGEHIESACDWLERQSTVTVTFAAGAAGLTGPEGTFGGRLIDSADFPDHLAFLPPTLSGDQRALLDREWCLAILDGADEHVWLELSDGVARLAGVAVGHPVLPTTVDRRIRFTTDLLRRALRSLPGPGVLIDHRDPVRPCLLTSPVQPDRTVVVMPARAAS